MTPRSVYILGAPGSGKSSVMERIVPILGLQWEPDIRVHREVWVTPLSDSEGVTQGIYWGKHRKDFPGTDSLSLSGSPWCIEWLRIQERDMRTGGYRLPEIYLGEGMRLANSKFLVAQDRIAPLLLVHLTVDLSIQKMRLASRGHQLTESFVKAGTTRARSTFQSVGPLVSQSLELDTSHTPSEDIAREVCLSLWGGGLL